MQTFLTPDVVVRGLLDMTIRGTVLLVVSCVVTLIARRSSAAIRHRIWSLTMISLILLPILSWLLPSYPLPISVLQSKGTVTFENSPEIVTLPNQMVDRVSDSSTTNHDSNAERPFVVETKVDPVATKPIDRYRVRREPFHWVTVLILTVWSIGFCVCLNGIGIGFIHILHLVKRSTVVADEACIQLVNRLCHTLKLRRAVEVRELDQQIVPQTCGWFRPQILLPSQARQWPESMRRAVLLHELIHVQRCDTVVQLCGRVACSLYWFHPLAWFGLHRLRLERELACDDAVVHSGERPDDYATQLVEVARLYHRPGGISLSVAMAQKSGLEQRLVALFDGARNHSPIGQRLAGLLLVISGLVLGTTAVVQPVLNSSAASAFDPALDDSNRQDAHGNLNQAPDGTEIDIPQTDQVLSVAVSSDGKLIAGGGFSEKVRVWDAETNRLQHKLSLDDDQSDSMRGQNLKELMQPALREFAGAPIRAVAFQPGSQMLYAAAFNGIYTWDTSSGLWQQTLFGAMWDSTSLAFSPDGTLLAGLTQVIRNDKLVSDLFVWKAKAGAPEVVLRLIHDDWYGNQVAFSPDGKWLAATFNESSAESKNRAGTKSQSRSGIKFWSTKGWEQSKTLLRDRGGSYSVSFSPDGRQIADGGGYRENKSDNVLKGEVLVWDIEDEVIKQRLTRKEKAGPVRVSFSPDGKAIAAQHGGRVFKTPYVPEVHCEVTMWDVELGRERWNVVLPFAPSPHTPTFLPDGRSLITCDQEAVRMLDASTGREKRIVTYSRPLPTESHFIEVIERLGGVVTRDETLPGKPVVGINFQGSQKYTYLDAIQLRILRGFKGLKTLNVGGTQLRDSGLKKIYGLKNLETLELYNTGINDSDLWGMSSMPNLTRLNLMNTQVTSKASNEISRLTGLSALDLSFTEFTDAGLAKINELKSLKELSLAYAMITDNGMKEIGEMPGLEILNLSGTQITDAGVEEIKGLKGLKRLILGSDRITDASMKVICEFKNLTGLDLNRNGPRVEGKTVTDEGLVEINKLEKLNWLDLSGTQISDAGMKNVGQLKNLETLWITNTGITDQGLKELHGLSKLSTLAYSGSLITEAGMKEINESLPKLKFVRINITKIPG